ncbi:carbohydrate binding domain-containing protein [Mycobacterium sp. pUA109]|uniref:carbohydrate binding domain-containing protein n=1 Tax=Mycobacterium sp. pUA109 TaxID=3238982 RepID=UPI00351B6F5D
MTYPITPNPGIHQSPKNNTTPKPLFTQQQLVQWAEALLKSFTQGIIDAILGALGLTAVEGPVNDMLAQLETALTDIPQGNIAGLASALESAGADIGNAILAAFGFSSTGNIVTDVENALKQIPGANIVGEIESAFVNGANVIGQLLPSSIGPVSVSQISNTTPELLINPGFNSSTSLSGDGIWTYDATTGHTSPGSATVTANGTQLQLISNPIPVTQGQQFNASAWAKWSGLAASGAALELDIATYLSGSAVATTQIQAISNPAASASWTELSGTYTVPSGVDTIRLQLTVNAAATAGQVWFDDGSLSATGLMPQNLVENLVTDLESAVSTATSAANDIASLLSAAGAATVEDLASMITSSVNNIEALIQGAAQSTAAEVGSLLSTAANDVQGVIDGLFQAFNGGTSTGNAVSTVKAGATAIPASNVVGITPATVVFGAAGAGGNSAGNEVSSLSTSWTHTIASTDTYVLVPVIVEFFQNAPTSVAASFGADAMDQIFVVGAPVTLVNGNGIINTDGINIYVFGLKSPPSGAQTVSISAQGSELTMIGGDSVSYMAARIASTNSNSGTNAGSMSESVTLAATENMAVAIFAGTSYSSSGHCQITSFTGGNQRYNLYANAAGPKGGAVIGDSQGSASFSAVISPSANWCSAVIELSN